MRIQNYLLLAVCMLLFYTTVSGQSARILALKNNIARAKDTDAKLIAVFALCEETESLHKDSLYRYAQLAKQLALQLKSVPAIRLAGYYEAYSYYHRNLMDSVFITINEHLPRLAGEAPASDTYKLFRFLQARYRLRKQEYKEALTDYYALLSDGEKTTDTLTQVKAMAGIGSVLLRTGDPPGALSWFLNGIRLGAKPVFRNKTIYLYTNAAVLYNRLDKPDSAEYYVKQGIQYAREAENLADLTNSLGMYAGNLMDYGRYPEAEKALQEAITVSEMIGDPNDILSHMGALAMLYYAENKPQKGIDECMRAIAMIEKYKVGNKIPYIYEMLAKNYELAGNYQASTETLRQLVDINDSLHEKNAAEAVAELRTKFEVQQKENTIIRQQLDLVKKDYLIYASIALFLAAAITAYFLFTGYRKRQRQKAARAVASAEESERKRIAADLHDNLGAYAASIASNVNRLADSGSNDPVALQEVRNNSHAIVSDLSDTIWALKKEELVLTAVSDRLKLFIQRIQPGYPLFTIDVYEDIVIDHALTPSQGFHLFQTIQEAVNNALKHSGGNQVSIHIQGGNADWSIRVTDNGSGMAPASENQEGGNGLFNMKNRAAEAGWDISWSGEEGKGISVIIRQQVTSTN